ncbi:MAG: hypothetical protein ACYCSH_17175 [Acidithiobacillus sp.]
MKNQVYIVQTDLPPNLLGELAVQTYKMWVEFAIGKTELGGKLLRHPTGNYAAHIHKKKTGPNTIEIWADESVEAPEVSAIEYGHPAVNLKSAMLTGPNAKNVHTDKAGYKYRVVPIKDTISASLAETMRPSSMAKASANARTQQSDRAKFRVMSDKPGSSPWIVPAMTPYAPAMLLSELLQSAYGKGA